MKTLLSTTLLLCMSVTVHAGDTSKSALPSIWESFDAQTGINPDRWEVNLTARSSSIGTSDHGLKLQNRAYLFTKEEQPADSLISFQWNWEYQRDQSQSDVLTVLLHTTGKIHKNPPYKSMDGIEVHFNCADGRVSIELCEPGTGRKELASAYVLAGNAGIKIREEKPDIQNMEVLGISPEVRYAIQIVDLDETISVAINGKMIVFADYSRKNLPGNKIGFGNQVYAHEVKFNDHKFMSYGKRTSFIQELNIHPTK